MKQRLSLWQLIGLIVSAMPALFFAYKGIKHLFFGNALYTPSFAFVFFVLPTIAAALAWLLILWRKKVWVRVTLAVLTLLPLFFFWTFILLLGTFHSQTVVTGAEALSAYAETSYSAVMPDELGSPTDVTFVTHTLECAIFRADSNTLLLTYSPEAYTAQTACLNSQSIFHTEPFPVLSSAPADPLPPEFTWEGWYFRYLSEDQTTLSYPSELILVGTNDAECAITYVYFKDIDLDYIDSHEEFLLNECGWQYLP